MAKPKPIPPKLDPIKGGDRLLSDITRFEQHMNAFHVEQPQWTAHIRALLQGEALEAYLATPPDIVGDYDKVKQALLERFNINKYTHMSNWWNIARRSNESATQLAARLMDLTKKCVEECATPVEGAAQFAQEHLLRSMPTHIACWVRSQRPTTVEATGRLCDQYLQDRGLDYSALRKTKRWTDTKPFHEEESLTETLDTSNAKSDQVKHQPTKLWQHKNSHSKEIPNTGKKDLGKYFSDDRGPMCFHCNEWGYMAATCPKKIYIFRVNNNHCDYLWKEE